MYDMMSEVDQVPLAKAWSRAKSWVSKKTCKSNALWLVA